ncbi:MAG: clostripain-related cysteine peptidase [Alistipes sp.]
MRKLRLVLLLFAVVALSGCSKNHEIPTPQPPRPDKAPQTLLFFLAGRGNLVSGFDRNISNIKEAISHNILGYSRVLVFRQTSSATSEITELSYLATAGRTQEEVVKRYDEPLVSVDGATVTRVLKDMIALAPAEHYGLVMGSHATGWVTSTHTALEAPGGTAVEDYWKKTEGAYETRSFGYDNGRVMDITTLAKSLTETNTKFEYLIFDACFMSSIEALYDLRTTTKHILASPCEVMMYGIPYQYVLPQLMRDHGTTYNLQGACESFNSFYSTTTETVKSGCIAQTNCDELEALSEVMRRINATGQKPYDLASLQYYEGLSPHLFYDMDDFVRASCNDATLLTEFKAQFDRTFPAACRLHTPSFYTVYGGTNIPIMSYSGVSISEPSSKYTTENRQTAWYIATHR